MCSSLVDPTIGNGLENQWACLGLGNYEFLKPSSQKILRSFPRHPQRALVECDCWTSAGPIDTSRRSSSSSFICRTTGRACALVTERAWVLTMRCCDDDQRPRRPSRAPSRRRAAARICRARDEGVGGQNSSTSAEPQLQRPLFSRKRTLELSREMSALCQKRTFEGCGLGALTGPVTSPCWLRAAKRTWWHRSASVQPRESDMLQLSWLDRWLTVAADLSATIKLNMVGVWCDEKLG